MPFRLQETVIQYGLTVKNSAAKLRIIGVELYVPVLVFIFIFIFIFEM